MPIPMDWRPGRTRRQKWTTKTPLLTSPSVAISSVQDLGGQDAAFVNDGVLCIQPNRFVQSNNPTDSYSSSNNDYETTRLLGHDEIDGNRHVVRNGFEFDF